MTDWRTIYPGAAAAHHIREWMEWQIRELERGADVDTVRANMIGRRWARDFDMSGVPTSTMDLLGVLMLDVWNKLTPPYDVQGALEDLRHARGIVTPGAE